MGDMDPQCLLDLLCWAKVFWVLLHCHLDVSANPWGFREDSPCAPMAPDPDEVPEATCGSWCPDCGVSQAGRSLWLRAAVHVSHSGCLPQYCQRTRWGKGAPGMGHCPEHTQAASWQERSSHLQNILPDKIVRYVPAIC